MKERFFDEKDMYTYIEAYAVDRQMTQTMCALPYARQMHEGQFRKGKTKVPYIYHPLLVACQAVALGLDSDDFISTALLHDVCEDCGVEPKDLPVGDAVKEAVCRLTKDDSYDKNSHASKEMYYQAIAENELAVMVKILDRCCNVSGMSGGFTKKRMVEYIQETEEWFYPMIENAKKDYPEYEKALFAMHYHILSVVETIKHLL